MLPESVVYVCLKGFDTCEGKCRCCHAYQVDHSCNIVVLFIGDTTVCSSSRDTTWNILIKWDACGNDQQCRS